MLALALLLAVPIADPIAVGAQEPAVVVAAVAPPPLDPVFIAAPASASLLLVEAETGQVLLARDVERRRPVASAIKLLTALVVVDALPPGTLVAVSEEVEGITGSRFGLQAGDVWSVEDLLIGLLLRSGNDVAVTLAHAVAGDEAAFVARMEERLDEIGIEGVRLGSATGLEPDDALSASELAIVARAALAEPRIRDVVGRATAVVTGDGRAADNRNLLVGRYEGATGLKTGYTDAAGFTLAASAQRDGRELIAVVLGTEGEEQRLRIASALLDHGFERTSIVEVGGSLVLRTGDGPVQRHVAARSITVPTGMATALVWPATTGPDTQLDGVELVVGRDVVGVLPVETVDARARSSAVGGASGGPGGGGLGASLVDGVYAGLRAASLAGVLR
jgi:serine-type D-Ala-D-Ala carboxypeptidase (penicillin-binding protein 5/6)